VSRGGRDPASRLTSTTNHQLPTNVQAEKLRPPAQMHPIRLRASQPDASHQAWRAAAPARATRRLAPEADDPICCVAGAGRNRPAL